MMWAQFFTAALGIWLTASPAVLGLTGPAAMNAHIFGPLIASVAIIACWEVTRPLRWINVALGVWLFAAPWLLGSSEPATVNAMTVGALVFTFSLVKGALTARFGGGWSALWRGRARG